MSKLNVGVFFGGISPEHDVSKASAVNIISYLDTSRYSVIPIYISKDGEWFLYDGNTHNIMGNMEHSLSKVTLAARDKNVIMRMVGDKVRGIRLDVAIPALHGPGGEDGTIQGVFETLGLPYVGCGVLSSAICMDKTYTRFVARDIGVPITPKIILKKDEIEDMDALIKEIRATLGYPCFIKPASSGSSIGTGKAKNKKEVMAAIEKAFKFDDKIIVEKFVKGKELECAVLGTGGEDTVVSFPGEIMTTEEFYDYDAKYNNPNSKNIIPANVSEEVGQLAKEYALKLFKAVGGKGLARVDFFLEEKTGKLIFNEINTMPGFTNISMYPQLMFAMGYERYELMDRLIEVSIMGM